MPQTESHSVSPYAEPEGYSRKKAHYQADRVAADYDAFRWSTPSRRWSNQRKLLAIRRAVAKAAALGFPIRSALDLPCGTGRILPLLSDLGIRATGGDLSMEMMGVARQKTKGDPRIDGFARCDAEFLPFPDGVFDGVFSVRFLFHLPPDVRRRALREMARISRQWVIVDYRHRYTLKYRLKQIARILGISRKPFARVSREEIARDFSEAGVEMVGIFPTYPLFSDKWVILGRKIR